MIIIYKTLHNICYRQIIYILFIYSNVLLANESYFVMYPNYNQNLINMLEVDNFHKIIENEIINKCNECSLDYNESKKNIINNEQGYNFGNQNNYDKIIYFDINRFNKKIKLSYYILNVYDQTDYMDIISIENIADIKNTANIIIPKILVNNLNNNFHIDDDSLKYISKNKFGIFWGKYYDYRNSYNYNEWNLYPHEFTSIGVSNLFSIKEYSFTQFDFNILAASNVNSIGFNLFFNTKIPKIEQNYTYFTGLGIGYNISTWEQINEDIYFSKNSLSLGIQSGFLLFTKKKYNLMLRLNYEILMHDDFIDFIGANLVFYTTNTRKYDPNPLIDEFNSKIFETIIRVFFETLLNSNSENE